MAREIIHAGLQHREFIDRATTGLRGLPRRTSSRTRWSTPSARPACRPRRSARLAHAYATADRAMICWTLGITEHHNAVDNVLALINLALLTGHVGRYGSGLNPLRGQNNVQGGGDMGALPDRLPGFQHVENDAAPGQVRAAWGVPVPPKRGWHLSEMFDAMERGELRALRHRREPGPVGGRPASGAAPARGPRLHRRPGHLPDRRRPSSPTSSCRPAAAWAESEGTVTNSERRVQRVRKALDPPGEARDDLAIVFDLARRDGPATGATPSAEDVWNELRSLSPVHAGMSYARLEAEGGLQWPCYDETHPGELFLHSRLWEDPVPGRGRRSAPVDHDPPVDKLDADFPIRLTTGRRLDSLQHRRPDGRLHALRSAAASRSTSRPRTWPSYRLTDGERVRVRVAPRRRSRSRPDRRVAPARAHVHDPPLPGRGHHQLLTIDATDPNSGTAEFKATAIRIEPLDDRAD